MGRIETEVESLERERRGIRGLMEGSPETWVMMMSKSEAICSRRDERGSWNPKEAIIKRMQVARNCGSDKEQHCQREKERARWLRLESKSERLSRALLFSSSGSLASSGPEIVVRAVRAQAKDCCRRETADVSRVRSCDRLRPVAPWGKGGEDL